MINKLTMILQPYFLLIFAGMTWFKIHYLPTANFLLILCIAMFVDLITGIAKAWANGQGTTSIGLRRTVKKFIQYGGFIIVGVLLLNITFGEGSLSKYRNVVDVLFLFIILIEFISICENLIEISPDSKIVKYVIRPFMEMIKSKITINKKINNKKNNRHGNDNELG